VKTFLSFKGSLRDLMWYLVASSVVTYSTILEILAFTWQITHM